MRIAIATVQVPFMKGGAEIHADMLEKELLKRGHKAEIVTIPFKWYMGECLLNSMNMGRMMDLSESNGEKIDRVIGMKFPAYYAQHKNKVLWLLHQHRSAYDLWNTEYGDLEHFPDGEAIRDFIWECDNKYLPEAKRIYTNAQTTADRLMRYNGILSTALYHPPLNHEKLHCKSYGDFVFYASRINALKRQSLLVEAARYVKTKVRIVIAGGGDTSEIDKIKTLIAKYHLEDRVSMPGFISEQDKIDYYANCLAVYFGTYNEDYGYITLEGFFSEKPVIVHKDSGGPLEFVQDGYNGYVTDPDPELIAEKIDYLYEHRNEAKQMGKNAKQTLVDKHMNWNYVIDRLLED